jgi:predicted MFS family arabinose efflux permease
MLLRGAGGGIAWVFSTQLLLQLVPNHVRGRVFATEFAIFSLMAAAGAAATGRVLDTSLGMSEIILWMAGLSLIPGLLWTVWLVVGRHSEPRTSEAGLKP